MNNKKCCIKCGKKVNKLYNPKSTISLTEGYCKECSKYEDEKDLELLKAIKNNKNLSRFL